MLSDLDRKILECHERKDEDGMINLVLENFGAKTKALMRTILKNKYPGYEDDIMQKLLLKLVESFRNGNFYNGESGASFYTWFSVFARNEAFDFLRRMSIRTAVSLEDLVINYHDFKDSFTGYGGIFKDGKINVSDFIATKELVNILLNEAPEHHKQMLILRYVLGFNTREVHEFTGINENTIKVKAFRARRWAQERLGRMGINASFA
ncbi:MAG: hypothetical protein COV29_01445 [Candidatus Yanofskybacteria bacterium CG10_big_fil_rev_8_21_14_0_10_36_16]|uniref:RNA polymerase sigma factor 70 region 4 type 2 domain-containing protein n=1 Tax=Candidatus Yanofskybacteria bacterium CG10_big_fil_rev_8_21_14_0_10_36_16 TaxID=1975096 RepID=A0A2J0Q7I5_9BACT|nr:MAG: hypothetical protein COV29_01445 [Candidatus Yanofskybacteria bacterium CG10_big_fil_rev_8_21_14_0_10_36_16]